MSYYNQSIAHLLHALKTGAEGLSAAEVQKRLEKHGRNELQEKKKVPVWLLFLYQFKDVMIVILAVAAILSGVLGEMTDTIIILVIIVLNAVVGFIQEYRAEKAMEALKKMTIAQAQVLRENKPLLLSSAELVPGDVVVMEAGNVAPADIRLLEAHAFRVDESSLTGESIPVDKTSADLTGQNIPLGDQLNMAFKGTLGTGGRAQGVGVAAWTDGSRAAGAVDGAGTHLLGGVQARICPTRHACGGNAARDRARAAHPSLAATVSRVGRACGLKSRTGRCAQRHGQRSLEAVATDRCAGARARNPHARGPGTSSPCHRPGARSGST